MRIILTHEQADFDALASLLGGWLLDDSAAAVLPNRVNRNVRAFLNLYGAELPFIERRDLPQEPVELVTLVDTQSMVSLRGVTVDTPVRIIDHHLRRPNLPPGWTLTTQVTGAATTLLVEALREQNRDLSTTYATLLLLGIYEDTGSLTYTRTTPRDLQAAAFLLGEGASLAMAVDFLNHPLSPEQQKLYEILLKKIRTIPIHGHTVLLACGDAGAMEEELSTITHRLRDLLDPDALFMLVKTGGGVQLIARSTSDQINVADVAGHFGGGGHERAAAALIRDRSLRQTCVELERILPQYVRPAITVAQIMSSDPQLITAEAPVEEIAHRMQRYGYEGFPVVRNGKLVGLLNRRAVDRAMSHKLYLTADSLMEAGDFTVQPADSIEHLKRVMTETGWGQIPVVHPESGAILGIVTRTDLLKTLAPEPHLPGHLNLAERLEASLPPGLLDLLRASAFVASELHLPAYVVGGFVRDLILERPSLDFDMVVEGDAIALGRALVKRYGGRLTSHGRFGTAKWFLQDAHLDGLASGQAVNANPGDPQGAASPVAFPEYLDLISARTEFYTHPTALPTVERSSIKLDLHRRDFTINTLALRLDGHHYGDLYDYWGGLDDLRKGRIRVLHSISFVDDPTRTLRAVRFEQRFGFRIVERTLQLLKEALPLINRVSGDRIRHELDHMLDEKQATRMLEWLAELGLLEAIHPCLTWDEWISAKINDLASLPPPPEEWGFPDLSNDGALARSSLRRSLVYSLWFIRLDPDDAQAVMGRLKMAAGLSEAMLQACWLWHDLPELAAAAPAPSVVASRLDGLDALALYSTFLASAEAPVRELIHLYVSRWQGQRPVINGNDLRARGLPPGPIYARLLAALRNAWLDGQVTTPAQEAALLEELLRAESGNPVDPEEERDDGNPITPDIS